MNTRVNSLVKRLRTAHGVEHGSGATKELIDAAERAIALKFPADYREFLTFLGWMILPTIEIAGVGDNVPRHLDIVARTKAERTEFRPFLRDGLIPICNDGTGSHYCIDATNSSDVRACIVYWDHELYEDQTPTWRAASLADWLEEGLDAAGL